MLIKYSNKNQLNACYTRYILINFELMRREVLKLEFKTVLSFTSELQNVRLGNFYKF